MLTAYAMQKNSIHILSTRPLEPSLIGQAAAAGIVIEQLSLIATEPVEDLQLQSTIQQLAGQSASIAITSINAAKAVAAYLAHRPAHWNIFTVGTATRDFVSSWFGEESIVGVAEHATGLADLILNAGVRSICFFCGDQRRDELPAKLAGGQVQVQELVVYRTIYTPGRINGAYDGILFFSPGAARSFFSVNNLPPPTVLFAIGNTTAESIRACTPHTVVTSERPAAAALVEKLIAYFTHINIS